LKVSRPLQGGAILLGGTTNWVTDFDPGPQVANSPHVYGDFFVTKWLDCVTTIDTIQVTACNDYTWQGQLYTQSGLYGDTLQNSAGCNSILILDLTIFSANSSSSQTVSSCYFFNAGGQIYTATGTYTQIIPNYLGCDSTITWNVTIFDDSDTTLTDTFCTAYTLNGQVYTSAGTHLQHLTNAAGCDSLITLTLTHLPGVVDTSVVALPHGLQAQATSALYQWLDCSNGFAPIPGATSAAFLPSIGGLYAVEVTQNGCVDTSACFVVTVTDLPNWVAESHVQVFPNPSSGVVYVQWNGIHAPIAIPFEVLDPLGRRIGTFKLQPSGETLVDLSLAPKGCYLLRCMLPGRSLNKIIVLQ
jgi:hypothetical protein